MNNNNDDNTRVYIHTFTINDVTQGILSTYVNILPV